MQKYAKICTICKIMHNIHKMMSDYCKQIKTILEERNKERGYNREKNLQCFSSRPWPTQKF